MEAFFWAPPNSKCVGFLFAELTLLHRTEFFPKQRMAGLTIGSILLAWLFVFPFLKNPASVNWEQDMKLTGGQNMATGVAGYLKEHPISPGSRFFYKSPYLSVTLNIDHFDSLRRLDLTAQTPGSIRKGDIILWDSWFAVVEAAVQVESMANVPGLVREIDFTGAGPDRKSRYVILRKN